ncbi:hypothetical protein [Methylobacterium sp. 174MFSha1.1]|uniref:hypothetical protein n=1 Tax=Methylobacterium sp. 174MFSha1.1 TaxID=1502749 RepID=UPI0011605DB8|nr:hypothetical protein [Methylobacterium sp. 174MFSha1.1]
MPAAFIGHTMAASVYAGACRLPLHSCDSGVASSGAPVEIFADCLFVSVAAYTLSRKRSTTWIGYTVHLTVTCDPDRPRLITHVATTLAPIADRDALESIHADLAAHDLFPDTHLVDAGYVDADLLLARTRAHAVTLLGPSPQDTQWQSRQSGTLGQSHIFSMIRPLFTAPASWPRLRPAA